MDGTTIKTTLHCIYTDTLCNMSKNIISSNGQGTKSVKLTARIGRKLMNNACHGWQKRWQEYFRKLRPNS